MRRATQPLVRFTDEELALFGAEHPVVDMPYLGGLDERERQLALQVAYRSLCSHGAVAVDGGSGMELPEDVVTMLQVRECSTATLLISKATADLGVLRYHHLGTEVVVLEDVSDGGAHEFRLISPDALPGEVHAFCTIDGARDGEGAPVTISSTALQAGGLAPELWGEGIAQLDATVWRATVDRPGEQVLLGFLLGTGGSWSHRRTAMPDEDPARQLQLQPARVSSVGARIMREFLGEGQIPASDEWHLMRA
ncbi:hypothetical protein [Flexivirga lutea]